MQISSKSHYALRAMVELAVAYNSGNLLQLKTISERHDISKKYLEQIFILLKANGLVESRRGYSGGFVLARDPQKITVYDILKALESTLSPVLCLEYPESCDRWSYCAARRVWNGMKNCIRNELCAISLAYLAEEQNRIEQRGAGDYVYQI